MFGVVCWRGVCVSGADGRFRRAARGGGLPGPPVGARDSGPVLTGHIEHFSLILAWAARYAEIFT
jgi:hypothetical protein